MNVSWYYSRYCWYCWYYSRCECMTLGQMEQARFRTCILCSAVFLQHRVSPWFHVVGRESYPCRPLNSNKKNILQRAAHSNHQFQIPDLEITALQRVDIIALQGEHLHFCTYWCVSDEMVYCTDFISTNIPEIPPKCSTIVPYAEGLCVLWVLT